MSSALRMALVLVVALAAVLGVIRAPVGAQAQGDAFNGRLQKFTSEGDLLAIWHPDDPELAYPSGVAVANAARPMFHRVRAGRISS